MENFPGFQPVEGSTFRSDPALDARLHLERGYGTLRATCRWYCWKRLLIYLPGTVLLLATGILFLWRDAVSVVQDRKLDASMLWMIFWVGFLIAGLWGLYQVAASLINHTTVEVTSGTLTIKHSPLPYPGSTFIHYSDLKEFCTKQTTKQGLFLFLPVGSYTGGWTPKASFYQLGAVLRNGREVDLVYGPDEHTIRYLEAALTEQMVHPEYNLVTITDVIPDGLEVQQGYGSLKFSYRWFSWKKSAAYASLTVFFLAFTAPFYTQNGFQPPDTFSDLVLLLVSPLVTIFGIYELLANLINATSIEISRERLSIHHGPLPHPGNRSVACSEIDQLVVAEQEHKSDQPANYQLVAYLKGGQRIVLWSKANKQVLAYLKQAVEGRLPGKAR